MQQEDEKLDERRVNVSGAPGQVNDGLTLQPTAGEQPPSIHQQGRQTTNHTAGWRKDPPSLWLDFHAQTHFTSRHVQIHREESLWKLQTFS